MMNQETLTEGRFRLQNLLPAAIEAAKDGDLIPVADSKIGHRLRFKIENMDALVIHPGAKGGWHVDLVLKDMPEGFPNVIGSPSAFPFHNYQEAIAAAPQMLAFFVKLTERASANDSAPIFDFHGVVLELIPSVLQSLSVVPTSTERSIRRLGEITQKFFPNGVTRETWEGLSPHDLAEIITVVHMAGSARIVRYPLATVKEPNELRAVINDKDLAEDFLKG